LLCGDIHYIIVVFQEAVEKVCSLLQVTDMLDIMSSCVVLLGDVVELSRVPLSDKETASFAAECITQNQHFAETDVRTSVSFCVQA